MALRDLLVRFGIEVDQTQLIEAQNNVNRLVIRFNQLQRIAGFALAALGAGQLTQSADDYITLENRIKAVTETTDEFNIAMRGVIDVSRKTSSPIEDVTELYQRYTQVTTKLGASQEQVIDFTHRVTQAMKLGGGTAGETRGALIQLAQGIGTNFKSAGQEIRSIQEQSPILAKIIAKAAGGTTDELMAMAKSGKLTSKLVFEAVRDAGPELDRLFAKRTMKFEDISNRFRTEWLLLVKQMMPAIGRIIQMLSDVVQWTQKWIEDGSALNTVIAGLTTAVIALTLAFAPLIAQLVLAAAPWAFLFLIIEDFVTFMRDGESIIGDFFNAFTEGGAEGARAKIQELWGVFKNFIAFVSDPNSKTWETFYQSAKTWIDRIVVLMQEAMLQLAATIENHPLFGPIASLIKATTAAPGTKTEDKGFFQKTPGEVFDQLKSSTWGQSVGFTKDVVMGNGPEAMMGVAEKLWRPVGDRIGGWLDGIGVGLLEKSNITNNPMLNPAPSVATSSIPANMDPYGYGRQAPQITNQITVEGSATPAVAREIAERTGAATVSALGRDRAAIGAAVGIR